MSENEECDCDGLECDCCENDCDCGDCDCGDCCGNDDFESSAWKCAICFVGLAVVALIIVFIMSFATINVSEIGIQQNSITKTISDRSFSQGIHIIGPSSSFKVYKTSFQNLELHLNARSEEGLRLTINGNIQYQIENDTTAIVELFKQFGDIGSRDQVGHETQFYSLANDIVRNVVSKRKLADLQENKTGLVDSILSELKTGFNVWQTNVNKQQLKEIIFPTELNDAVEETTDKKNQQQVEENNLRNTQLEMEGKTALAEGEKDAIIKNATSIVNKQKASFFQNLLVDNDFILKTKEVQSAFISSMGITDNADKKASLFKMLFINNYQDKANASNVIILNKNLASALECVNTETGICPA